MKQVFSVRSTIEATWKLPSLPRKKKPQQDRSEGKEMLELF
jgi:hypothetical protein